MALEGKGDGMRGIKDLNLVALRERKEEVPLKPAVAAVPVTRRVVSATGMEAGAVAAGYRYRIPGWPGTFLWRVMACMGAPTKDVQRWRSSVYLQF
jgi:hypothetical protein